MKGCALVFILLTGACIAHADPRQWNHAGIPIRQGQHLEWFGSSAQDDAGNTLLVWSDTRTANRDIYAQLVSPAGTFLWADSGINVSPNAPDVQENPVACAVNGGWIVAWVDYRVARWGWIYDGEHLFGRVWAQKLDNNGNLLWTGNDRTGMPVDTAGTMIYSDIIDHPLSIVDDGNGGAFVGWLDYGYGGSFVQNLVKRVLSNGQMAWTSPAPVSFEGGSLAPAMVGDGGGNVLVATADRHGYYQGYPHIFATKILADGQPAWGDSGLVVCAADSVQSNPVICPDGNGGCVIAWVDFRNGSYPSDLYVQRLNADGQAQWQPNGVVLCNAANEPEDIRLAVSINGGACDGYLAAWEGRHLNDEQFEIVGQKISPQGSMLWASNGLQVCADASDYHYRLLRNLGSDLAGGAICVWEDYADGSNGEWDLRAARILSSGSLGWNGFCGNSVADGPHEQQTPCVTITTGSVVVAYDDQRDEWQSLRVQKLAMTDGSRMLAQNGSVVLTSIDGDAEHPLSVAMSAGRTGIVWLDFRMQYSGSSLYYQIVDNDGRVEKPANGARLVPDNDGFPYVNQENHFVCPDGSGGFFATFEDLRDGTKRIRLMRVNSAGNLACDSAAQVVWSDSLTTDQIHAYCAPDGEGGCYVAWSNYSHDYILDAYVMRMNSNCQRVWQQPVRLTNTTDDDVVNGLVSSPDSSCIVVWQSGSYYAYNASTAKVNHAGNVIYNFNVCDAPNEQTNPTIILDAEGQGGAFFTWEDKRNDSTCTSCYEDIYAQHLGPQGEESWPHNGVPVIISVLPQVLPKVAVDVNDNLTVVWQQMTGDWPFYQNNLIAQRISPAGSPVWQGGGVAVCNLWRDRWEHVVLPDNGAGLFIAWTDGGGNADDGITRSMATHFGPDGTPVGDPYWSADSGGALSEPTLRGQYGTTISPDGSGGFVAAWSDKRADRLDEIVPFMDLYAQHLADAAGARELPSALPKVYALSQNYPNPFNPTTVINFALPKSGMSTLKVFDLLGRTVTTLVNRTMPAGTHSVNFDASRLASGVYFYRLQSGSFTSTRKMVLIR